MTEAVSNNTDQLYAELLQQVKVAESLTELIYGLENLEQEIFDINEYDKLEEKLREKFGKSMSNALKDYLIGLNVSLENKSVFKKEIEELIKKLEKVDDIKILFAVKPDDSFIDSVYMWLFENLRTNFVIDYQVDPDVVGGLVLIYQGRILDLSINTKLRSNLNKESDVLAKLFE